jgi:hypothetical protein
LFPAKGSFTGRKDEPGERRCVSQNRWAKQFLREQVLAGEEPSYPPLCELSGVYDYQVSE